MNVLFISDEIVVEPLGIMWLSSYLKNAGHATRLANPRDAALAAWRGWPQVIAFSITTGCHNYYLNLSKRLQKISPLMTSIFGGPHVTFFPEFALKDGVDVAIGGEGFEAIVDVVNALERGHRLDTIENVVQANGNVSMTLRPLLDKRTLLMPDRDLIYACRRNRENPIKNVMCSFQCKFQCTYCYSARYKELYQTKKVDIRPVDSIMAEIADLLRYHLELIFFQDDVFPLYKHDWLDEFCTKYAVAKVPFHIQTRPELITEERIKKLKDVGLHGVTFAIESGNMRLRQQVLNRNMDDSVIINAANILHDNDVRLRTENMIGIPGETMETALETIRFNALCKPTIGWASLYQPYPGTPLGDLCIQHGLFDGDVDAIDRSFFEKQVFVNRNVKYQRLQKIFSFLVAHPRMIKLVPLLMNLGSEHFYSWFYRKYKSHLYQHKLYRV